jgi:hypothetical protein
VQFKRKYINPAVIYLVVYIFGFVIFASGTAIARYSYAYLNYLLPSAFPIFSPVSEKDGYAAYLKLLDIAGISIAILIINYIAMRFDNDKFEFIISKTDGQYTVVEGTKIYVREFAVSDIISAVLFPIVLTSAAYFIPNDLQTDTPIVNLLIGILNNLLWLGNTVESYFKIHVGILLILVISAASRAILTTGILKRWRAAWLSGSM